MHLLRRFDVPIAGAHVVVIGRGVTVGRPLGLLLTRRSENATVTLCHTGTRDLPALTRQADIIVAAVGVPHMLTADMVRPGAAVVDVGVSRVDGKLTGDVHPGVWEVAGHVSPNPGGVGPLTRAFLLTNVVEKAEAARESEHCDGVRRGRDARSGRSLAVGLIFLVAFLLVAANFWRRGAVLIGIGVGVAAVLRLALSDDRAGLLVVRTKSHRLRDDGLGGGVGVVHRLDHRPAGHQLEA